MSGAREYPAEVWRRFRAPGHAGAPPAGARVGRGGDRRMGGDLELWFTLDRRGLVARAEFRAFGCPFAVASADLACETLPGRDPAMLLEFDAGALITGLGVPPERFPVRIWIEDAVRAAARAREAK